MAAETPRHASEPTPWWRRLLTLEPVAVQAAARSVFVLASALGIAVTEQVQTQVLAVIAALYTLVEAVTALWTRARVTPNASAGADVSPT